MKRASMESFVQFIYSTLDMISQHSVSVALMNTFIRSMPYVKCELLKISGNNVACSIRHMGIRL